MYIDINDTTFDLDIIDSNNNYEKEKRNTLYDQSKHSLNWKKWKQTNNITIQELFLQFEFESLETIQKLCLRFGFVISQINLKNFNQPQ